MTQPEPIEPNPKSGKGVAKQTSRYSPAFWSERVFRPTYTRDGEPVEVAEFYARVQVGGRRESVPTGSNDREQAARRAARLYAGIRSKGWDAALLEHDPDRQNRPSDCLTVGAYVAKVQPLAKVRARSWNEYVYSLRSIARGAAGMRDKSKSRFYHKFSKWREEADAVSLDKLTAAAIEQWKSEFIAAAGKNPVAMQRARRSVNSFIRNARALFSRRILKRLGEVNVTLPSPRPFEGVELERQGSTRYVSTIDARQLLVDARAELAESKPEVWKVVLLALGAGLRRSEIDMLQWRQIDFTRGQIRVMTTEEFETKTDDSNGVVFVDPGLLAELKRLRDLTRGSFVVQPETKPDKERRGRFYRCDDTLTEVTAWLRAAGVSGSKPLHTLRKEFGSLICESADIFTASRQLRHSNIGTTAAFYTDHRKRAVVAVGDMLAGEGGKQ